MFCIRISKFLEHSEREAIQVSAEPQAQPRRYLAPRWCQKQRIKCYRRAAVERDTAQRGEI